MRVGLCSRSSGDDESPVQEKLWPRRAADDEALVKMEL